MLSDFRGGGVTSLPPLYNGLSQEDSQARTSEKVVNLTLQC